MRGDVAINGGYTLNVAKGARITLATTDDRFGGVNTTKCEVIVNGTLKADSATFIGPTKGSWYGIRFNSTASSSSYMNKCIIENATIGVSISGSDPTIQHCNIKSCDDWGIYISSSSAWPIIDNNYIEADLVDLYFYNCSLDGGLITRNSFRTAGTGVFAVSG